MKKFFLALAMFLPLVAMTACGGDKDNDEPTVKENGYKIYEPVLKWGKSQDAVMAEVAKNSKLTLDVEQSDEWELVYWSNETDLQYNMPMYYYGFDYDQLEEASVCLPGNEYSELLNWVSNRYKEIGQDEDGVLFMDNTDITKATTGVLVMKESEEGLTLAIAAFVPLDDLTKAAAKDPKSTVAKTLKKVSARF